MQRTKEDARSEITALEADISSYNAQIRAHEIRKNDLVYRQKKAQPREAELIQQQIYSADDKIAELKDRIENAKKTINSLLNEMTVFVKKEQKF